MFENLSLGHLLVVLVIFLLLFGAKRIPEIAGSLGQGINQFKKSMSDDAPLDAAPPPVMVRERDEVTREPKRLM